MKELMNERRWCVRDQQKKPYMSFDAGGKQNDPSTWLSYAEADKLWKTYPDKFTGLGLYFSVKEGSNLCLCGIDIDSIHHDADHPNPLADEILDTFKGTYAEWSPSKTGYHILLYVDMTQFPFDETNYPFRQNNREIGLEAYVGTITNRYFTFSGDKLDGHNNYVTDQTEQFIGFLTKYMSKPRKTMKKAPIIRETKEGTEDFDLDKRIALIRQSPKAKLFETLFDKCDTSKYKSESEADYALLCMLVPWLEGNPVMLDRAYRQSALFKHGRSEKWDSTRAGATYGERTIMAAITAVDDPYYSEDPAFATGDSISPEDIVKMINDVKRDDKVTVLPFACGLGKSTAISYKIAEVLQSEGTDGLIVVTDKIERMYGYKAPANTKLTSLKEYLELHGEEVFVLESNTVRDEPKQHSCRVLILSTQRFFQRLSREQIIEYTNWEKGKRPLILIDEWPGVLEPKRLTVKSVSAVADILQYLRPKDTDEQEWCIEQWDKVVNIVKTADRKYRRKTTLGNGTSYYFCQYSSPQMTEDDVRFERFIYTNSYAFYDDKRDPLGTIRAARQLFTGWGVAECQEQTVRFFTLIDHQDKLKDIGAKVIILDGTADLSPEYEADLYDVRESSDYRRWLDRLHIHLVDYPTTRDVVEREDPEQLAAAIKDYAWRNNKGKGRRSVVFTYKAKDDGKKHLETELQALFNNEDSPCNVDHLGAIRGKNEYLDSSFIIQYGLLQYSRTAYMLYALRNSPILFESLQEMDEEKAAGELKKLEGGWVTEKIRSRLILTDIEQNFFRGSISIESGFFI